MAGEKVKCDPDEGGQAQLTGGKPEHFVPPVYPLTQRSIAAGALVVLYFTIAKNGEAKDIQVVSSPRLDFTGAVLDAVRKARFSPPLRDGLPEERAHELSVALLSRE
jgi:TonB family protein